MNALCANAVYMEICITIMNSNFTSLRCPHLKEIRPCQPGRPAIKIVDNIQFQELVIMDTIIFPQTELIFEITENPNLPIPVVNKLKHECERCNITANLDCGLQGSTYTNQQLVAACAGKKIIRPAEGHKIQFTSPKVTQSQMNAICSQAIFMEVCIDIMNSQYTALQCPYLMELKSCQPGRPAIRIVNNFEFETLIIPWQFIFPVGELIIEISDNPRLPNTIIDKLKILCPGCKITANLGCGLQKRTYSDNELVDACAGKSIIKPAQGYILTLHSHSVTEAQLNALCSKAVYMEICITIYHSQYTQLRCPYLRELRPCLPEFAHSTSTIYPEGSLIIEVIENPMIPLTEIKSLKNWCKQCIILPDRPQGLKKCVLEERGYNGTELVSTCAGKEHNQARTKGLPVYAKILGVTEKQMNDLCSNAVYMEISHIDSPQNTRDYAALVYENFGHMFPGRPTIQIKLTEVQRGSLSCHSDLPSHELITNYGNPVLDITIITWLKKKCERWPGDGQSRMLSAEATYSNKELVGGTAIRIVDTPTGDAYYSLAIYLPEGDKILEIRNNPRLSITTHRKTQDTLPGLRHCQLEARTYTDNEVIQICSGTEVIKPIQGFPLIVSSTDVTEKAMNDLCSNAVYMEICISIVNSNYRRLRCPRLRELRSCLPGRPAIQIVNNFQLVEFLIPVNVRFPQTELIFEITENPVLDITIITWLKKKCERCQITANFACDLQKRTYNNKELVAACAGKKIIRPAEGYMLVLSSSSTTEAEMNALCSQATFMEICIDITNSQYRAFRCPYLKELRPCQPGRPAIRIVDNLKLEVLEISWQFTFPVGDLILEITGNPLVPYFIIEKLKRLCPACTITANLGCDLQERHYSANELVDACAGKTIIKPALGYILQLDSRTTTEYQMNALCSQAIFMEICITISHSQYRQLRCPNLRVLRPCLPGMPAIIVTDNNFFETLLIPPQTLYPQGDLIVRVTGNPRLNQWTFFSLKTWCKQCDIELRPPTTKPVLRQCQLQARQYSSKELVRVCAGAQVIKPYARIPLMVVSSEVTETEMNAMFAEVVFMEICIVVVDSNFRALRFPRLQEIRPCRPGQPAIKVVGNILLEELYIPLDHFLACDLQSHTYTSNQLIAACAGKRIIRPAPGYILELSSASTTEQQMNALCSNAVFMEICIDITRSQYKSFRCPHLKQLRSCMPGRPAIRIVDNIELSILEISRFTFPAGEMIIEIQENPLISITIITQLKRICPYCLISANLDRPALQVTYNNLLTNIVMSDSLRVCKNSKSLEIFGNPRLSPTSLANLKRLCPNCIIH
ncbi:hypothetical protein OSTOST_02688 [Ostertagia ostertagi]